VIKKHAIMKLFRKLRALFRKEKLDTDMAEEMRAHLEMQVAVNVRAGMSADEAQYSAQREFGNVGSIQETVRDRREWPWLEGFVKDVGYAVRALRKSPGFTVTALLTLAFGIGANTALFSVINSILLRPLPFPNANQLTLIWETNARQGVKREGPAGPNFYDWRDQSRLFQDMAAVELGTGTVTGLGEPRQTPALRVTSMKRLSRSMSKWWSSTLHPSISKPSIKSFNEPRMQPNREICRRLGFYSRLLSASCVLALPLFPWPPIPQRCSRRLVFWIRIRIRTQEMCSSR